jgi:O-antigen/teichoic acid export membrane protein
VRNRLSRFRTRHALWLPSPLLGIGELTARASNLLAIVAIVRSSGVKGYGRVGIGLALLDLLLILADMGFTSIGTKELAQAPGQGHELRRLITRGRLVTAPAAVVIGVAAAFALPGFDSQTRTVAAITAFGALSILFLSDWALLALGRNGAAGAGRATGGILYVGLVFLAAHALTSHRLEAFAVARVVSLLAGALLTWFVAARYLERREPSSLHMRSLLSLAMHLGAATLFIRIYNVADALILGLFKPSEAVGAYRAAYTVVFLPLIIAYLLNAVLLPRLSAVAASDPQAFQAAARRFMVRGTAVMLAVAVVLVLVAGPLSELLYGAHTHHIAYLTRLLSPTLPLDFLVSAYSLALVAAGRATALPKAAGSAAATNVVLSFVLIPPFGATGAVCASLLSYLPLTVVYHRSWRRLVVEAG